MSSDSWVNIVKTYFSCVYTNHQEEWNMVELHLTKGTMILIATQMTCQFGLRLQCCEQCLSYITIFLSRWFYVAKEKEHWFIKTLEHITEIKQYFIFLCLLIFVYIVYRYGSVYTQITWRIVVKAADYNLILKRKQQKT